MKYLQVKYIPNILSGYRILAFPFIILSIYFGERNAFVWLIIINLITDILDGQLARRFGWESEFGARLDSIADDGTYICAFAGLFGFGYDFFMEYILLIGLLITLFILPNIISLLRFRRLSSLHLYSSKTAGYVQGLFFLGFFVTGFPLWFFFFTMAVSYIAFLEVLLILCILPELRSNVKGIFWLLKERKSGSD